MTPEKLEKFVRYCLVMAESELLATGRVSNLMLLPDGRGDMRLVATREGDDDSLIRAARDVAEEINAEAAVRVGDSWQLDTRGLNIDQRNEVMRQRAAGKSTLEIEAMGLGRRRECISITAQSREGRWFSATRFYDRAPDDTPVFQEVEVLNHPSLDVVGRQGVFAAPRERVN